MPENMVNANQMIVFGGILLALFLFCSIFLERPSAQMATVAIFSTALLCVMLQVLAQNNGSTSLSYCPQPISIPAILLTTFNQSVLFILGSAISIALLLSLI